MNSGRVIFSWFCFILSYADIRFPGFATYVPQAKDEQYNDEPLTEEEIKSLAEKEALYQKALKDRKAAAREQQKRVRAMQRMNKL